MKLNDFFPPNWPESLYMQHKGAQKVLGEKEIRKSSNVEMYNYPRKYVYVRVRASALSQLHVRARRRSEQASTE